MTEKLKHRLIGIAVLGALAVIFVPMMLEDGSPAQRAPIPALPNAPVVEEDGFKSNILPLPDNDPASAMVEKVEEHLSVAPGSGDILRPEISGTAASPKKAEPVPAPKKEIRQPLSAWVVQVGSFSELENAEKIQSNLRKRGFAAKIEPVFVAQDKRYRVQVGPEIERTRAEILKRKIAKTAKINGFVTRYP